MPSSSRKARPLQADHGRQVLIVDDSAVARAVMAQLIDTSGTFVTAGAVATVAAAHDFLRRHRVDVITLDLNMPGIGGLAALPDLIVAGRGAQVLVVSGDADQGSVASIEALALGAADTLVKPQGQSFSRRFADTLLQRLERLGEPRPTPDALPVEEKPQDATAPMQASATRSGAAPFDLIAIGASTGGIHAMSQVLRALPPRLSTPILVTQHLPATFMPYFAAQLAVLTGRPCEVVEDHTRIRAGHVFVAPGDAHIRCVRLGEDGVALRLNRDPVASGCMPSVDPMLTSAAEVYGDRLLAIVLSGMGRDGADGARAAHEAGASIVVQDATSSVIWGMPGAIATGGHADAVLPPEAIGALIAERRRP